MAAKVDLILTVGDRRRSFARTLENPDGTPLDLTGMTVAFRMVNAADNAVKINNAAAAVVTAAEGKVRFDWGATDVDTAGTYFVWFIVTDGASKVETYPYNLGTPDLGWFKIQFVSRP